MELIQGRSLNRFFELFAMAPISSRSNKPAVFELPQNASDRDEFYTVAIVSKFRFSSVIFSKFCDKKEIHFVGPTYFLEDFGQRIYPPDFKSKNEMFATESMTNLICARRGRTDDRNGVSFVANGLSHGFCRATQVFFCLLNFSVKIGPPPVGPGNDFRPKRSENGAKISKKTKKTRKSLTS